MKRQLYFKQVIFFSSLFSLLYLTNKAAILDLLFSVPIVLTRASLGTQTVKNPRPRFDPWVEKTPWRMA